MKRSQTIRYRKALSGKWLVYDEPEPGKTGQQYGRRDSESEAVVYVAELKADFERREAEIERIVSQPLPANDSVDDPFNHPAFWWVDVDEGDRGNDIAHVAIREVLTEEQLLQPLWYREWAHTDIVVDQGYESPYRFGRLLRQIMGDDNAIIFRYNPRNIYFAMATLSNRVAYYDPAKRDHIPEYLVSGEIDWFEAADSLSPPEDLITISEAAKSVSVSVQAVSNRIRAGDLHTWTDWSEPNPRRRKRVSEAEVQAINWKVG